MYCCNFINAKNLFNIPNTYFKRQIYRIQLNFLIYNIFVYRPAVRPSFTMARVPVFSHHKGNYVRFMKPLFGKMFIHCDMVLPFILYYLRSFVFKSLTEQVNVNCCLHNGYKQVDVNRHLHSTDIIIFWHLHEVF